MLPRIPVCRRFETIIARICPRSPLLPVEESRTLGEIELQHSSATPTVNPVPDSIASPAGEATANDEEWEEIDLRIPSEQPRDVGTVEREVVIAEHSQPMPPIVITKTRPRKRSLSVDSNLNNLVAAASTREERAGAKRVGANRIRWRSFSADESKLESRWRVFKSFGRLENGVFLRLGSPADGECRTSPTVNDEPPRMHTTSKPLRPDHQHSMSESEMVVVTLDSGDQSEHGTFNPFGGYPSGVERRTKLISRPMGGNCCEWLIHFGLFPLKLLLYLSIPEVQGHEQSKTRYCSTLFASFLWLGVFSLLLSLGVEALAVLTGMPTSVAGLTIAAIGTSIPNLFVAVIIARQGLGGMAISCAFGSSIFNILIGLGLPWLLYCFAGQAQVHQSTHTYHGLADGSGLRFTAVLLLVISVGFLAVVVASGMVLTQVHAYCLLVAYAVYLCCVAASA